MVCVQYGKYPLVISSKTSDRDDESTRAVGLADRRRTTGFHKALLNMSISFNNIADSPSTSVLLVFLQKVNFTSSAVNLTRRLTTLIASSCLDMQLEAKFLGCNYRSAA